MEIAKEAFYLIWREICNCFSGFFELKNYLSLLNNELTWENVERISVRDSHIVEWTGEDVNSYSVSIFHIILHAMFWILPLLFLRRFVLLNSDQMEIAKEVFYLIWRGICDCFSGIFELKNYLSPLNNELTRENIERISVRDGHSQANVRHKVRSKLYECFAFGLYFGLSYLIFNRFLLQFLFIQLVEWTGEDVNSCFATILNYFLSAMFFLLWTFPLLCLSKFFNFRWYQDIANFVLLKSGQKKYEDIKMSDFYADQIKCLVLQMIFPCQGFAIYSVNYLLFYIYRPIIPWYVEDAWYLFHYALLSSLYAFEYKWVYSGWPLHRRILNISIKWPYYFGFGLPLALIMYFLSSYILSMIVYSTLFPVYVISSTVTHDRLCPAFHHPCYIFKLADYLSDFIIKNAIKVLNSALGSS